MATYFAEINPSERITEAGNLVPWDGTVLRVIVAESDYINSGRLGNSSNWVECFLDEDGITNSRKKYPGIGDNYNSAADIFYPRQPYPSWTLDENYDWQPPIPMPEERKYETVERVNDMPLPWLWNEDAQSWET